MLVYYIHRIYFDFNLTTRRGQVWPRDPRFSSVGFHNPDSFEAKRAQWLECRHLMFRMLFSAFPQNQSCDQEVVGPRLHHPFGIPV